MIWLTALWHLLGAVADLSPATLVASIAVVVLAIALRAMMVRSRVESRPVPVRVRSRAAARTAIRSTDPDAPGRSRPRAPSA
jgi:hypothetical protein